MLLAGVDVGSTGLKVALYDPDGRRLGYAYREYAIDYGPKGRATLNPELWWESLQSCFRELSLRFELGRLAALGIGSANAMVLTDEQSVPLFPAIMQLDKRGAEMVAQVSLELGDDWLFARTGNRNAPGYQWGPTLKWLQTHEGDRLARVRRIFSPTSYLAERLTGAYGMDVTRAATTLLYCPETGTWDPELWQYFGLSAAEMPPLFRPHALMGYTLGNDGLPQGVPVAAGGIDTICAMLGLTGGTSGDVLILGSVGRFAAAVPQWDCRFLNTLSWNGSQKISMTPVNNGGTALKWVRNLLFSTGNPRDVSYDHLNRLAEQVQPGSDGLRFFPFLNGASCPHWSETVRGTFLGLEAYHTPGHLIRAVMEGVALSLGENQYLLAQCGTRCTDALYLGGGGARSPVWSQILCDVLGRELLLPEQVETETMGSALLGGMAAGVLPQGQAAQWNQVRKRLNPDSARRTEYASLQAQFSTDYFRLEQLYRK